MHVKNDKLNPGYIVDCLINLIVIDKLYTLKNAFVAIKLFFKDSGKVFCVYTTRMAQVFLQTVFSKDAATGQLTFACLVRTRFCTTIILLLLCIKISINVGETTVV